MKSNHIKANDTMDLKPKTAPREPILRFNFPGLKIGIGEYEEGPTGCTVFHFDDWIRITSDIRGGAPGVVKAHLGWVKAVTFSGGSWFGYEAITGVAAELLKMQEYSLDKNNIPAVAGAIIWDYGPRPGNVVYPDKNLARAAICNAQEGIFPLGNQGAGVSATVGKVLDFSLHEKGGQGGAFSQHGPTKILVFSVVNSFGAIIDKQGKTIRGHYDHKRNQHVDIKKKITEGSEYKAQSTQGNTTLTLVVTNQKFDSYYILQQVAKQIHASMARAIYPFHALGDGDVLFMVTTDKVENKQITSNEFGILASEVAWDAILSCFE